MKVRNYLVRKNWSIQIKLYNANFFSEYILLVCQYCLSVKLL
jgi:hypothetical protein